MWVSVVIPCYNVADYVAEALDSVLAQDYPWLEVIVVDNNSTDGTLAVLRQYEAQFPDKIRVLSEKKQGAPAARNTGWRAARGEWIQFLDADDLLLPGKISRQVGMVEAGVDDGIGFIAAAYTERDLIAHKDYFIYPVEDVILGLIWFRLGITSSNLWRKNSLDVMSGWDETMPDNQDGCLIFHLVRAGFKPLLDKEMSAIYYNRGGYRITNHDVSGFSFRNLGLRLALMKHLESTDSDILKRYKNELYANIFFLLRMLAKHDLAKANEFYTTLFSSDTPRSTKSSFTPRWYLFLCDLWGFYRLEKFVSRIKNLVPDFIWSYMRKILH